MLHIQSFVFNPFQENTYILYNTEGDAFIIDPGCYTEAEIQALKSFIAEKKLSPKKLINTHCHIDHVLGNRFVFETYGLVPNYHEDEIPIILEVDQYALQMGFQYQAAPIPETFLSGEDILYLGEHRVELLYVPGHSPGHLCLYFPSQGMLISGDTLFRGSIGRTDLPGGSHKELLERIKTQIYTLPDHVIVYPGHGPSTTIGDEKQNNPYIRG